MQNVHPHFFVTVEQDILFMAMTYLDLSYNKINSVPPNSFVGVSKLMTLHLNNNNLKIIQNGSFSGLGLLHAIDLSDNII